MLALFRCLGVSIHVSQKEVTDFWTKNFETAKSHILKPEYAGGVGVHPPYKWAHLDPVTADNAIAAIWMPKRAWTLDFWKMTKGPSYFFLKKKMFTKLTTQLVLVTYIKLHAHIHVLSGTYWAIN